MTSHWFSGTKENWQAFEAKCKELRNTEAANMLAPLTLQIIAELRYLNGCVVRGRGADIDSEFPAHNIFEYIRELESASREFERLYLDVSRMHTEMQGIAQNALQEVDRLTAEAATAYSRGMSMAAEIETALREMLALWDRVHGTAIIGRPTVNAAKKALAAIPSADRETER